MREYKVYGMCLSSFNNDGIDGRQIRAITAARTKKRAQEIFGITSTEMRDFCSQTFNDFEVETAMSKPEQLFGRGLDAHSRAENFIEISRSPHVVQKRVKRKPLSEIIAERAKRNFDRDELLAISERFSMANDPIGQSIAAKAQAMLDA